MICINTAPTNKLDTSRWIGCTNGGIAKYARTTPDITCMINKIIAAEENLLKRFTAPK